MKVTAIQIFPVRNGGGLKARVNVTLASEDGFEATIKGFRVNQTPGKEAWVDVPTERYVDKNGKAAFQKTVWLNTKAQSEISMAVLGEYSSNLKNRSEFQGGLGSGLEPS